MENIEATFYGNDTSKYMIVKKKGEEKLRIYSGNEEIFLEEIFPSNTYSSEISDLIFKVGIIRNPFFSLFTRKNGKIQVLYYDMIAKCIALCLNLQELEDKQKNELKKEIEDEITYIKSKLTDEIIVNNKVYYLVTYVLYVLSFTIILFFFKKNWFDIEKLKAGTGLFKGASSYLDTENFKELFLVTKSINIAGLGGLIALCFRMNNTQAFKYSYLRRNYVIIALVRGVYSSVAGTLAYYVYKASPLKNDDISNLYLLAAALGYSMRYLPSIFNKIEKEPSEKTVE